MKNIAGNKAVGSTINLHFILTLIWLITRSKLHASELISIKMEKVIFTLTLVAMARSMIKTVGNGINGFITFPKGRCPHHCQKIVSSF